MNQIPRLDILIYAHDGRGLGHVSRSVGVALAVRRLYPELKVLFVTGCRLTQELIGPTAALDWLKLPSYATRVTDGTSRGVTGRSMYGDKELGALRAAELEHLIGLYRPRLVLVDHTPQGKHRELVPAIAASKPFGTIWVLGVRGVVGEVPQAQSDRAAQLFTDNYHSLLWYGDRAVLGPDPCRILHRHYGCEPVECGYVVRLAELEHWQDVAEPSEPLAGTIAIPWLGEGSMRFLGRLAEALRQVPGSSGGWRLFLDTGPEPATRLAIRELFRGIGNCRIEPPGGSYALSLCQSKTAVIYGGYNSIMDILHVRLPSLVVYREMADAEQQLHLQRIVEITGEQLTMVSEDLVTAAELARVMRDNLDRGRAAPYGIETGGAARAARYLNSLLS